MKLSDIEEVGYLLTAYDEEDVYEDGDINCVSCSGISGRLKIKNCFYCHMESITVSGAYCYINIMNQSLIHTLNGLINIWIERKKSPS